MKEFPKGGLIGKALHAWTIVQEMKIPLRAAYAGYFIVLSIFPAMLLIISGLQYAGLRVTDLMEVLKDVLPEGLQDTAWELVYNSYRSTMGAAAGLSAVTALWSSSKGIYGLLMGLNAVYGVSENRGYVYTRGVSVLYSLAFLLLLLLTLVLHVFGNALIDLLRGIDNPVLIFLTDILNLRIILLLFLQTMLFTVMFMALPNQRNSFAASLPGAVLASLGWTIFSNMFSVYLNLFSDYSTIFGSVYGVAMFMLWLYFCLSILFYGGALNRYLAQERDRKKM